MIRRALNQKTASALSFEGFLDLASRLGCVGVEPRNDLGRPLFDGMDPEAAGAMASARGLRLVGVSEIYPFNDWNDERARAVESLIASASRAGAETISLIPRVDGGGLADGERQATLRTVLREIAPMLEGTGVVGLVEPIGFARSSLKDKAELVEAIEATGGPKRFRIVHDTFQHVIAGGGAIFPKHTALVHISGVSDPHPTLDEALDSERVLIDGHDRCGNLEQVAAFLDAGYSGVFSFECTLPTLRASPDLERKLAASFDYLDSRLRSR